MLELTISEVPITDHHPDSEGLTIPQSLELVLHCKGPHGLFTPQLIVSPGWYPEQRSRAHAQGWTERESSRFGHAWLCPDCSRKGVRVV